MTRHLALLAILAATWNVTALAAPPAATDAPSAAATTWELRLRDLEGKHVRQAADWEEAILRTATSAERDSLEALVPGRKQAQRREWLTLRLEQERARGDLDRIARLELELARVTPAPPPPATTFLPRDPDVGANAVAAKGGKR
jgi:hypothetical protein